MLSMRRISGVGFRRAGIADCFAIALIRKGVHMLSLASAASAARRWTGLVALTSLVAVSGQVAAQSEQQDLVNSAKTTFSNFVRDPDMTWLQNHVGSAKAVLIAPRIVKAGWIFGGSGG